MNKISKAGFTAIVIASALCSGAAVAGDILKCVNSDGQVTLTDDICPGGSKVSKVLIAAPEPVAEPVAAAPQAKPEFAERAAMQRPAMRYVNLARTSTPVRGPAPDTQTLRAARMHMQVVDSLRNQRMASLQ